MVRPKTVRFGALEHRQNKLWFPPSGVYPFRISRATANKVGIKVMDVGTAKLRPVKQGYYLQGVDSYGRDALRLSDVYEYREVRPFNQEEKTRLRDDGTVYTANYAVQHGEILSSIIPPIKG